MTTTLFRRGSAGDQCIDDVEHGHSRSQQRSRLNAYAQSWSIIKISLLSANFPSFNMQYVRSIAFVPCMELE